jgi:hypothetical protein
MIFAQLAGSEPGLAEPSMPAYMLSRFVAMDVSSAKRAFTINVTLSVSEI